MAGCSCLLAMLSSFSDLLILPRFTFFIALLSILQQAVAQGQSQSETVYSSVVFHRTGRRTPVFNATRDATTLTNVGAVQSRTAGQAIRDRYLNTNSDIAGFSAYIVDPLQVYALASDNGDFSAQAARAFMSGLFPGYNISSIDDAKLVDSTNVLWDGSYIPSPGGAQFSRIRTAGQYDVESYYLDASTYCPTFDNNYYAYQSSLYNANSAPKDGPLYSEVGQILGDSLVPLERYGYWDAWPIYDYLNHQYQYSQNYHTSLTNEPLSTANAYNKLRYNADSFLSTVYADPTNTITTISGRGLAAQVLNLLTTNVYSSGELSKLSLLFADFQPLFSFFALANLPTSSSPDFSGLPQYGSYVTFELFAFDAGTDLSNSTSPITSAPLSYPAIEDLYVRFLFANGSDGELTQYPLFAANPTMGEQLMTWREFTTAMSRIALSGPAEWCAECDAWGSSAWCLAYNLTAVDAVFGDSANVNDVLRPRSWIHPALAGLIGALVTLALLAVALCLVFFVGGVGFARRKEPLWQRRKNNAQDKRGFGGFKGGQKMASDADLTVAKGGAGANAVEKERVGSWELKGNNAPNMDEIARAGGHGPVEDRGRSTGGSTAVAAGGVGAGGLVGSGAGHLGVPQHGGLRNRSSERSRPSSAVSSLRPSEDGDDPTVNPFQDPVQPRMHV